MTGQAPVTVVDSFDASAATGGAPTGRSISSETIYTGHLGRPGNVDFYTVSPQPPPGSAIVATLSHLPADYDLVLYGPGTPSLRASPFKGPVRVSVQGPVQGSLQGRAARDRRRHVAHVRRHGHRSGGARGCPAARPTRSCETPPTSAAPRTSPCSPPSRPPTPTPFTVQVSGFNGAASPTPYLLRVTVLEPAARPACASPHHRDRRNRGHAARQHRGRHADAVHRQPGAPRRPLRRDRGGIGDGRPRRPLGLRRPRRRRVRRPRRRDPRRR